MAEACSSKSKRMSECWMVLEVCCYEVPSHPPPASPDGHLLLLLPPSNQITAREGKKGLSKTKMDDGTNIRPAQQSCTIHEIKSQNPSQLYPPIVLCPLFLSVLGSAFHMHACDGSEPQQLC